MVGSEWCQEWCQDNWGRDDPGPGWEERGGGEKAKGEAEVGGEPGWG